jgi:hypothetical protein
MASDQMKNQGDWAGVVKWVVLGVIAITALFLFNGEIRHILERTDNIEIGVLKIKTAQTLLGKASVSNETVKNSEVVGEGIQGSSYVNRHYNFQIAWSDGGGWSASDTMGKSLIQQYGLPPTVDIPLVIMKDEMVGNFRPNINVLVETIGGMSTPDYINRSIDELQKQGWQILTKDIDEATQGGFISLYNDRFAYKIYQFQRIVVANGKGYVITASQLPPDNSLSQQLKDELLSILNSFRIII